MATIHVDGVDLFYKEQGHGPPLLLIHGAGGYADIWGETFTSLAVAHRVIAYDRRGFRRSSAPAVKDYHRHGGGCGRASRVAERSASHRGGVERRGLTALDLVVHHPELVSSLVLVEPPLHAQKHLTVQMATAFIKVQLLRRLRGERAAAETFYRFATSHTTGGCTFERMPADTQAAMLDTATATMGDLDAGTGEYLTMEQIAAISCPVTCLLGELTAPAIANATRRIIKSLPNAKLVSRE